MDFEIDLGTRTTQDGTELLTSGPAQDYFIEMFTNHSTVHHNYLETVKATGLGHNGHGISFLTAKNGHYNEDEQSYVDQVDAGGWNKCEHNKSYNNIIVSLGSGVEFRFGAKFNESRDDVIRKSVNHGIAFADGASDNKVFNVALEGAWGTSDYSYAGIAFISGVSNMGKTQPQEFNNNVIDGANISGFSDGAIALYDSMKKNSTLKNNIFKNITVSNVRYVLHAVDDRITDRSNNKIENLTNADNSTLSLTGVAGAYVVGNNTPAGFTIS